MIHLATQWMTKPLICLGPLTPKAWVRTQLMQAKWSKETRRNLTVYKRLKGLDSKDVRGQEVVLEGAEGEVIGVAVIRRERLGARNGVDRRAHHTESQEGAKRRKLDGKDEETPIYATKFSKEEIDAQEKKPKRKVAVMIGYSGSGYKGMQLNQHEKTIEGDLFGAFVAAGAISKANADDPKKSSLVRCARTDKGVHAAGNLISLKLIVEDPDLVAKINEKLSPQIRVWGIERTNGSFNAYNFVDSRIYEYLIPTHSFLPPHPKSFLAKKIVELTEEADDLEGYSSRQAEVANVWAEMEEKYMKPVIEAIDPVIREFALKAFYDHDYKVGSADFMPITEDQRQATKEITPQGQYDSVIAATSIEAGHEEAPLSAEMSQIGGTTKDDPNLNPLLEGAAIERSKTLTPLEVAVRLLKQAHITAKRAYRIHPIRLARVQSTLSRFIGAHKFHNYTVDKSPKDASATRIIKSFNVNSTPIIINDTEWLSLKVHGQSFMMHQIRKMVSMVALIIRCGCHDGRMQDSFMADRISIPKAPSLGLLLERPVFDAYNERLEQFGHKKIDFGRYEKEMEEFKQREIYERIFREEEKENVFHAFFTALDNTKSAQLLYLSSVGLEATKRRIENGDGGGKRESGIENVDSEDEGKGDGEED